MSILPACIGVGGQPIARKSRLREFTLSLGAFNLRMQALRQLQPLNIVTGSIILVERLRERRRCNPPRPPLINSNLVS